MGEEMDFDSPGAEAGEYGDSEMAGDPLGGSGGLPGDFEGGGLSRLRGGRINELGRNRPGY